MRRSNGSFWMQAPEVWPNHHIIMLQPTLQTTLRCWAWWYRKVNPVRCEQIQAPPEPEASGRKMKRLPAIRTPRGSIANNPAAGSLFQNGRGGVFSRTITLVEQATGTAMPSETDTLTVLAPRQNRAWKVTAWGLGG